MASLRKILFEDLGTKSLALILALAVWVHVFSGQERQGTFHVPLRIAPLPAGLALASEIPENVALRVRATGGDLFKLSTRDFLAWVELENPHEGPLQRPLLGSDVRLPQGVNASLVEIIDPTVLDLTIEPTTSAEIPVAVRLAEPWPRHQALVHPPEADPARVRITGPRTRVESLEQVETWPVELRDGPGIQEVGVPLALPVGLTAEVESVEVRLETEPLGVERYDAIPVELLPPQGEDLIWVHPDSGAVQVTGATSIIQRVKSNRVRLLADLRGRGGGSRRIALRAIVPGLPASAPVTIRCIPESVSVRLQ